MVLRYVALTFVGSQIGTQAQRDNFGLVTEFHRNPVAMRDKAAKLFISTELEDMSTFFDKMESNPLTPEQRLAVATDRAHPDPTASS